MSVSASSFMSSLVIFFKYGISFGLFLSIISLITFVYLWGQTLILESESGNHSDRMVDAIKFSFFWFLFSEAMFFFGIFWCFFDSALSPTMDLGGDWPPIGIVPISPFGIPLFNTVVLLSSGVSLTWAHNCLLSKKNSLPGMVMTLILAFFFEIAQYIEYSEATFSMSDGIFGSCFYFGTGFHGLHVIFGHLFLTFNTFRIWSYHFTRIRHLSFELSILYWHFVDVVWLFLYTAVYWWSY